MYFFNKEVNIVKLHKEIVASNISDQLIGITQKGLNIEIQFNNQLSNTDEVILNDLVINHNPIDVSQLIMERISLYQSLAPELIKELYVDNTLNGITEIQSDQMFDDFSDVLLRIKEGAWPTAIYRLQNKIPSGYVTQELINSWIAKIQSKMVV